MAKSFHLEISFLSLGNIVVGTSYAQQVRELITSPLKATTDHRIIVLCLLLVRDGKAIVLPYRRIINYFGRNYSIKTIANPGSIATVDGYIHVNFRNGKDCSLSRNLVGTTTHMVTVQTWV